MLYGYSTLRYPPTTIIGYTCATPYDLLSPLDQCSHDFSWLDGFLPFQSTGLVVRVLCKRGDSTFTHGSPHLTILASMPLFHRWLTVLS